MSLDNVPLQRCRLCSGSLSRKFSLAVLGKYDVDYLNCEVCKSLQTAKPFWLDETYGGTLPNLDCGAARRALRTCSLIFLASTILGLGQRCRLLDFGGGDGFVCRYLRDIGFDAFVYDKYCKNVYAEGFSKEPGGAYDVVSAIEVLEHLAEPNIELSMIFSLRPSAVIVSTDLYRGQGHAWKYLGPEQGGHVFFYSENALKLIATRYGYTAILHDSSTVFVRERVSRLRRAALALSLRPIGLLLGRLWLQLIRPSRSDEVAARQSQKPDPEVPPLPSA